MKDSADFLLEEIVRRIADNVHKTWTKGEIIEFLNSYLSKEDVD